MEHVYNKMLHKAMAMTKGRNSGRDKITRNKGEFRDGVCLKHLNGFE